VTRCVRSRVELLDLVECLCVRAHRPAQLTASAGQRSHGFEVVELDTVVDMEAEEDMNCLHEVAARNCNRLIIKIDMPTYLVQRPSTLVLVFGDRLISE
jgi:hypothetical protein